ncbi:MAG: LysR family transcriptional regulator [Hungatella sp.]|nr:LysR family transcriptional regulator [Hungatella sp.]
MDLRYLEYIVEIANQHSISRAADRLFITQSNLSQYLSRLEEELGTKLFDRRRNDMTLTTAGTLYVDTCRDMLLKKQDLYNQISDIAQAKTGNFSVGITPQWGAAAFSRIIGPFKRAYPNIQVSVLEETAEPLTYALLDNRIDMAIIPLASPSALPQNGIMLAVEELLLAIPKAHVESLNLLLHYIEGEFPTVDIGALAQEPFIFSQSGTTIRKLENICFSSKHIFPNIIAEINSHPASLFMVEEQLGATFVPVSCAAASDKIQYAHVSPSVQWFVAIAFRKGFIPRQSEEYFIQLAQKFYNNSFHDMAMPEL